MPRYFHRPGTLPKTAHKELKYKVVIYLNQKPVKTLYRSRTIYPARKRYFKYLEECNPYFPKKWDWLGNPTNYELLLLGNWGERVEKYKSPSGVVYDVERTTDDGFFIKEIRPYQIEEKFKHFNEGKMITFKDLIKLMVKEPFTKTIVAFNNKVLVEIFEKDEPHLFILKNTDDAERLYHTVKRFYYENKLTDCFFFTKPPRGMELMEFYDRISERLNFPRKELKKISTRC